MNFIRLVKWEKIDRKDCIKDIYEFNAGPGNVFRTTTGTCTRLFSRLLKECIEEGAFVTIEKG